MRTTIRLVVALGVIGLLIAAVTLGPSYLRKLEQEREWMLLQDACDDRQVVSCVALTVQVTPACTRDGEALACYHLARLLDRGLTRMREAKRIVGYYEKACRAGIRPACAKLGT